MEAETGQEAREGRRGSSRDNGEASGMGERGGADARGCRHHEEGQEWGGTGTGGRRQEGSKLVGGTGVLGGEGQAWEGTALGLQWRGSSACAVLQPGSKGCSEQCGEVVAAAGFCLPASKPKLGHCVPPPPLPLPAVKCC